MAPDEALEEHDSSHVEYLYRSSILTRGALAWYSAYGVAWLLVTALEVPALAEFSAANSGNATAQALATTDLDLAFILPFAFLLPLSALALRHWRSAIRALERDLPSHSSWVTEVARPLRRAARWATAGWVASLALGVSFLAVLGYLATTDSSTSPGSTGAYLGAAAIIGIFGTMAAIQVGAHWTVVGAVSRPISSSEDPQIDADLDEARRSAKWTLPTILVTPVVVGVYSAFFLTGSGSLWWLLGAIGIVAPLGLLVSIRRLRSAYTRWTLLAGRLIARQEVV